MATDTILDFTVIPTDIYSADPSLFALDVYGVPRETCNAVLNLNWQLPGG